MAENQYIVETKFTADTEEFKQGAQKVQNELDKMNDKLTETEEATTVATESVEDFTEEVLENISTGKGWLSLLSTIISTFAVKFYSALTQGRKEIKEINAAISSLNGTIEQAGWAATISVNRFNELRESWEKLSPDDKIAQFNDYKAALHDVNVEVASLNDLENKLIKDADKVATAIKARAQMAVLEPKLAEAEVEKGVAEAKLKPLNDRMTELEPLVKIERMNASPDMPRTYSKEYEKLASEAHIYEYAIKKSSAILDKYTPYYNQLNEEIKALQANVEEGSIDALTAQLKNLETQFNATGNEVKRTELGNKIEEIKKQIAKMKGETDKGGSPFKAITDVAKATEEAAEGSLEKLREKRAELEGLYSGAPTEQLRLYYQRELDYIDEAIAKLDAYIKEKITVSNTPIVTPEIASAMGSNGSWGTIGQHSRNYTPEIGQTLLDNAQAEAAFEQWADGISDSLSSSLQSGLTSAMSDGIQALSDAVMGIGDIDASQVVAAFLQPFAQMAVSMGETLIASGIGAIALKNLLMNPWTAIAAGTALVALGSIASSAIQKSINNATGSGGTGGGGNTWTGGGQLAAATNTPLQIEVYGTLSGQDIVLAGNNYTNNQRR